MKKLLLILLCFPFIGFGQVLAPSLVSSSGNTFSSGNVIMDFSLGEVVITTNLNSSNILTQGFHQEILKVTTQVVNIDIKTKVFPNPTTSSLTIELDKKISAELLVYDIKGRVVIKDKLNNENTKTLNFGILKQGNYLLYINTSDQQSIYKIQKIR